MRLAAPKRILGLITPGLRGLSGVETQPTGMIFCLPVPKANWNQRIRQRPKQLKQKLEVLPQFVDGCDRKASYFNNYLDRNAFSQKLNRHFLTTFLLPFLLFFQICG
jgi:hypothetical protein